MGEAPREGHGSVRGGCGNAASRTARTPKPGVAGPDTLAGANFLTRLSASSVHRKPAGRLLAASERATVVEYCSSPTPQMEYPPAPAELAHHSAHHTHAHPQPTPSKRRQIAQRAVAFAMTALVGMSGLLGVSIQAACCQVWADKLISRRRLGDRGECRQALPTPGAVVIGAEDADGCSSRV